MKRFFKEARVVNAGAGKFSVALDGRPVKTPERHDLSLPIRALAEAVRDEWDADEINPARMPLTRFAATAIDRVADNRDSVIDEITGFGESDLLCHRAEDPPDLVARQRATWQPLLDWAWDSFQVRLVVTAGVMPVDQSPKAMAALRAAVAGHADMTLSGLHGVTTATGSVVIGLAVVERHLDAQAAWDTSQVDEDFQAKKWGEDEEASTRRANLRKEMEDAVRFLELCGRAL